MLNVVFTGPAFDKNGNSVLRADLAYACTLKGGIAVQNAVKPDTNVLIASRKDTVKAKAADQRGVAVFTYPEFISRFLAGGGDRGGWKAQQIYRRR